MKRFRFLSILIIAATLAGCGTETVNNSATAPGGTTGAAVQTAARPTDGYETQSIQTEGQTQSAPTSGNTSGATAKPTASSSPVQNEIKNGPANNLLRIDNYIYTYIISNDNEPDEGETYRIDIQSGHSERINDVPMYNMMYNNGWIYYTYYITYLGDPYHEEWNELGFCRMKPDGSQKNLLCKLPCAIRNTFIQDGYLYAITDIYSSYDYEYNDDIQRPVRFKMNSDGSLGNPEYIFNDKNIAAADMLYYNGSLYYTRNSGYGYVETEYDDFGLYKCKPDGTDNIKIGKILNGKHNYFINDHYWFFIYDDWIYYSIEDLDNDNNDAIYKMRLDGTGIMLLCDGLDVRDGLNYMDGWVYFTSWNATKSVYMLCRVKNDGTGYEVLFEGGAGYNNINLTLTEKYIIYGETIYGTTKDDNIYRMNLDGSDRVKLEP